MADKSDMQEFIIELMDNHVPSIGPETGKLLLRIIAALDNVPNPSEHVQWYKTALQVTTRVVDAASSRRDPRFGRTRKGRETMTQVSVSNKYYFRPQDVDLSSCLGGTFGKMEVELAARNLVAYLVYANHTWNNFKLSGLCWYYDHNNFKDQPLFGLMGPWFDDGPMIFREGIFVVNMTNHLAVTDEFLRRIRKFVKTPGK